MKTLNFSTPEYPSYPVGGNIDAAKRLVEKSAELFLSIKAFKEREVNIFCRGSSGAILATLFAVSIPVYAKIIHIRKEGEIAHSRTTSFTSSYVSVIIDDFILSGQTMNAIYKEIQYHQKKIDCLIIHRGFNKHANKLLFTPSYLITNNHY